MLPDNLPRIQRKVYDLLIAGKMGVSELSAKLRIADPRGHIRELRRKGFNVKDDWRTSMYGNQYKIYWIPTEATEAEPTKPTTNKI